MRAVIFANGIIDAEHLFIPNFLPGDVIIAADGGVRNCLLFGIHPDIVIGDLDSISEHEKRILVNEATYFITFPRDKDQTDLELALDFAIQNGAEEVLLLGLLGGRLDQTLANLLLLTKEPYTSTKLIISASPDTAQLLRDHESMIIEAEIGDIVSLIPLSPQVDGVTTNGLRWALDNAKLDFGSTLSISNEMTIPRASIKINAGKLLVIHRQVGNKV